jgi:argininosuccinate lyase
MMPQKRNPDALELARGSGARAIGDLATLLATLKGLPSGYNKDLQDDKRVLFDAVDTILLVLPAVSGALQETCFNIKRMRSAVSSSMMATDLADYLVEKGATFRDAHSAIGSLIRESEREDCELDALPLASFKAAHSLFGDDVLNWLEPARSVARRDVPGGTGPSAVAAQLRSAREALWPVAETARGNELVLRAI